MLLAVRTIIHVVAYARSRARRLFLSGIEGISVPSALTPGRKAPRRCRAPATAPAPMPPAQAPARMNPAPEPWYSMR